MRKAIKKWVVDTITDEYTGAEIPIRVDPDDGMFWAEYPKREMIEHEDRAHLKNMVRAAVKANNVLNWEPVIVLDANIGRTPNWAYERIEPQAVVGISLLLRAEQAQFQKDTERGSKETVSRWRTHELDRDPDEPLDLEPNDRFGNHWSAHVLPYSDVLWETLKAMEASLLAANARLRAIVGDQKGTGKLSADAVVKNVLALRDGLLLTGPATESKE